MVEKNDKNDEKKMYIEIPILDPIWGIAVPFPKCIKSPLPKLLL